MGCLLRWLLLVVVVVVVVWVFRDPIREHLGVDGRATAERAERGTRDALRGVDLDPDRIAAELRQTGRVVRRKAVAAAHQIDLSTRDLRTSAKIKARYALDPQLKASGIDVHTDKGRVTLSGHVDNAEDVAKAIRMAMEEDNVTEVSSSLQVTRNAEGAGAKRALPAGPGPTPRPAPVPAQ